MKQIGKRIMQVNTLKEHRQTGHLFASRSGSGYQSCHGKSQAQSHQTRLANGTAQHVQSFVSVLLRYSIKSAMVPSLISCFQRRLQDQGGVPWCHRHLGSQH